MKKIFFPLALLTLLLSGGCLGAGGPSQKLQTTDARPCSQNFTYDGSFLGGRTYKTYAIVTDVSEAEAIKRAVRKITADGWQVSNTDATLGTISASQTVSYGQGKTAPLNVSISSAADGVRVDVNFSTSGGVTSPLDAIQNQFCGIIEAVEGK